MKYIQIATVYTVIYIFFISGICFNEKKNIIISHIRFRADKFDSRQVQLGGQLKSASNDNTQSCFFNVPPANSISFYCHSHSRRK